MKKLLLFLLLGACSAMLYSQNINLETHRKTLKKATKLFEQKDYQNSALAFQKIITHSPHEIFPDQMLTAALAFAQIEEEDTARDYLTQLTKKATKPNIDSIKNSSTFQKYHSKKWWTDLNQAMEQRIKQLILHHQSLRVFNHQKIIRYRAIRINAKGDTIANTIITVLPDGTGWGSPTASLQSQVIYQYQSSTQDSLDHIQELRDIVHVRFWNNIDTTGVIENENKVWMHPFRNNEFFKTEIAPFPLFIRPINYENMLKERPKIIIMRNWGTYSPTMTKEKYFYLGTEHKTYTFAENILCQKFDAYGHNSAHGVSYLEYYFHEAYGFVEMNYLTYDNDIIQFKIIEIKDRE